MASGEVLRRLFKATATADWAAVRSAAEAIVDEERQKNHLLLADDLERIIRNGKTSSNGSQLSLDPPRDKERGFPLVDVTHWDFPWERLVAPSPVVRELQAIADENHRGDLLTAAGLSPRQRVLLVGPPGCGKTLSARILASQLHVPLAVIRFDALISSYLGETAANLRRVFEFLTRDRYVALFDEFDAIGKERDNPNEHGELKRVVSAFLQLLDSYSGASLLVAATNHGSMLDSAIWRRFDAIIRLDIPRPQDRVLMLRLFLRGFETPRRTLDALGERLGAATGADLEQIAVAAARSAVLDGRRAISATDIEVAMGQYRQRLLALESQRS